MRAIAPLGPNKKRGHEVIGRRVTVLEVAYS
jgi:hypothetical protein